MKCRSILTTDHEIQKNFAAFVQYVGNELRENNSNVFDNLEKTFENFKNDSQNIESFAKQFVRLTDVDEREHNVALVDQNTVPFHLSKGAKIKLVIDHRRLDADSERSKKLTQDPQVKIVNDPEKISCCIVVFEHCVNDSSSLDDVLKEIEFVQGNESNDVDSLVSSYALSNMLNEMRTDPDNAKERATVFLLLGAAWDYVRNKKSHRYDDGDAANNESLRKMLKFLSKKYPFFDSVRLDDFLSDVRKLYQFYNVQMEEWFKELPTEDERIEAHLDYDKKCYADEKGNTWKFCNLFHFATVNDQFIAKLMTKEENHILKKPGGDIFKVCFWVDANDKSIEGNVVNEKKFLHEIFPWKNDEPICEKINWQLHDPEKNDGDNAVSENCDPTDAKKRRVDKKLFCVATFVMKRGAKRKLIKIEKIINEIPKLEGCRKLVDGNDGSFETAK